MGLARTVETSVAGVFITDELSRRVPKKTDYLQEKIALQDLAARMADRPAEILPRFVDLAMQMAGGVSAGLSLYEENPAPGVFRWQYLRGILEPFNGTTTPRNFSPCGITLDLNTPVLSAHPERVYSWIADANIVVPEVLLVPLHVGSTDPLGTLWIISDEDNHFDSGHARVMTEMASFVGIALRMLQSEQRLQKSLEEQETLTREMSHRVKNLFAIADGMIRVSARNSATKEEMAEVLTGRMHALASAHSLVRRNFHDVDAGPRASDLVEVIEAIVRPHVGSASNAESQISIEGPPIQCGEHAVNGIALVIHELATNAAKYGALKIDQGRVDIGWRNENGNVVLNWTERDGPAVAAPPAITGFGSVLAQRTITGQFGGTLDCDWRPAGLAVTITIPVEKLSA
jgi:two-component sensor histidine kinase